MKKLTNELRASAALVAGCLVLHASLLAGQILFPPPRDATPVLRADEKWRKTQPAAPETGRVSAGLPREDAGLRVATFKDERGETINGNDKFVLKSRNKTGRDQIAPSHATGTSYSDGKYVHQWITTNAYKFFVSQVEGADLSTTYLGSIQGSFSSGNNELLKGTFAEDQASRDPLNQSLPYMNHFCAGADGSELNDGLIFLGEYDSAYEQANNIWKNYAKTDYPGNKPRAYYRLGHVAHLLTDMTVPAHVHNDAHPLYDPYEDAMATDQQFMLFYYGCTRSGLSNVWNHPLSLDYTNLRAIFYRTANYTEDYDSDEAEGDGPPYFYPSDYPTTWHRPAEVHSDPLIPDDIDSTELTIMADDLMPYAIRRVAELLRLWYQEVDVTGPTVAMTYPASENPGEPTVRDSLSAFDLAASASDAESGILKRGYQYKWSYWTGSGWSSWLDVSPSPAGATVSFTPSHGETAYAFYVIAENGGGHQTLSNVKYARVYPRLAFQQSGSSLILTWSSGTLLCADDVTGPWSVVSGATSPWTNTLSGARKFFRLKQ